MQDQPISLIDILKHAARWHGSQKIVSRRIEDGRITSQTYRRTLKRTAQLANALSKFGVTIGDRIATMAWNTHRHVEVWYATAGTGTVCHTINPRLFPTQIEFIVNHAEDRILFIDADLIGVLTPLLPNLKSLEAVIIMTDSSHMPNAPSTEVKWLCYEDLLAGQAEDFDWKRLSNDSAASSLCYTSGTTGNPKGVLYSHRSTLWHALASVQKDAMNVGSEDLVLVVVPMFHASSWGLAFSLPMVGAKMILPGAKMEGASLHELLETERATVSAAVPTIWNMLLSYLSDSGSNLTFLKEVVIGGSAVPRSMIKAFKQQFGVHVVQAWGMTETSPMGTMNRPLSLRPAAETLEEEFDRDVAQGRPPFGVDIKIVDDEGAALRWDGDSIGKLMVRGPWTARAYFGGAQSVLIDGWFDTGDVATIDEYGFMTITDRSKDIIKSGGEWISSVAIENLAVSDPSVELAACLGIEDAKWGERPLLLIKLVKNAKFNESALRRRLSKDVADWQLPDKIAIVDEIPLTATGKIDKRALRSQLDDIRGD